MFEFLKSKNKRGLILMVVVLWAASLATLVFLFVDQQLRDQRWIRDAENETQARWLAYGGIHKGLQTLSATPRFRGLLESEKLNGGEVRVEILENRDAKVRIQSVGSFHGVSVEAWREAGQKK